MNHTTAERLAREQAAIAGRLSARAERRADAQRALDVATESLRETVREARATGISKPEIATLAGVSRPTVDKWLEEK